MTRGCSSPCGSYGIRLGAERRHRLGTVLRTSTSSPWSRTRPTTTSRTLDDRHQGRPRRPQQRRPAVTADGSTSRGSPAPGKDPARSTTATCSPNSCSRATTSRPTSTAARAIRRCSSTTRSSTQSTRPRRSRSSTTSADRPGIVQDNLWPVAATSCTAAPRTARQRRRPDARQGQPHRPRPPGRDGYFPDGGQYGLWAEFNRGATPACGNYWDDNLRPRATPPAPLLAVPVLHGRAPTRRGHARCSPRLRLLLTASGAGQARPKARFKATPSHRRRPARQARRARHEVQALPLPLAPAAGQDGAQARQGQRTGGALSVPTVGMKRIRLTVLDRHGRRTGDEAAAGPARVGRPASGGRSAGSPGGAAGRPAAASRRCRRSPAVVRRRRDPAASERGVRSAVAAGHNVCVSRRRRRRPQQPPGSTDRFVGTSDAGSMGRSRSGVVGITLRARFRSTGSPIRTGSPSSSR